MIPVVQGLGRIDIFLIQSDHKFGELKPKEIESSGASTALTDKFTLSYLWVLGAYELVRTIDQRCRATTDLLGSPITTTVNEVKRTFERLRVPLAKFEPAKRHEATDSHIAYPAINENLGVFWRVSPDKYIGRRELSDILLDLLERIAVNHLP